MIEPELAAGGAAIGAAMAWRRILLSDRRDIWCLVDAEHHGWLTQWNWNWGWHARTPWKFYAKRNTGAARSTLYLHRELLIHIDPRGDDFHAAHHVDHINGNSLDNRAANLRWLTPAENRAHKTPRDRIPSLDRILSRLLEAAPREEEPPF